MPDEQKPIQPSVQPDSYALNGVANGAAAPDAGAPKLPFLESLLGSDKKNGNENGNGNGVGNVFTKLFGTANAAPQVVEAVPTSLTSLLGPKPKMDLQQFEDEENKRTKFARTLFQFSVVALILVYGYFYTQLHSDFTLLDGQFGPNTATRFESSNLELQAAQTQLNLVRFRSARLRLDEINGNIDPFQRQTDISNSDISTPAEKAVAASELQILGAKIKNGLTDVQKIFAEPLGIDIYSSEPISPEQREEIFENMLKGELMKESAALGSDATRTTEIRVINDILRLVDNKRFRKTLVAQDFSKISEKDFSGVLTTIREQATDELSLIDKVRRNRLDWGRVIQDVHSVTRKADLYYGQGLFKTVGGFLFNAYNFDAKSKRVSLTGITKTADSKTFSFIAKLVDSIERSPKFKDIDFRSFSKSRDLSGDFTASINLDFMIQDTPDPRDDVPQISQ